MNKVAHYLQEHLSGEVTTSPEVRRHFSQDASVLRLPPLVVVYPRNENDVRKVTRFAWQLAERGKILPITARGGGSDTSGAALGSGILLVFTAHMDRILSLNAKTEIVSIESGIRYDKLEQALYTHGLFLPPYPASHKYATLGGGIANNAIGEKSVKYGPTSDYVEQLRVVLSNGEVIETHPLSHRELNRKMGLATFEGEVYRAMDTLLEENHELIENTAKKIKSAYNSSGYNLFDIRVKGGFDLTPLMVGSQGTLGIITEATLEVVPHNPLTHVALASFDTLPGFEAALKKILELKPSVCEMINGTAISRVSELNPQQLAGLVDNPTAAMHLIVEFDDRRDGAQKKLIKKLKKIVDKAGGSCRSASEVEQQEKIWMVRESISTLMGHPTGPAKIVPIAEDVSVPLSALTKFLDKAGEIYRSQRLNAAVWGHAGEGVIRMQPMLDLSQIGDRQKLFRISEDIYSLVGELGGSLSAGHGDGRMRTPYLDKMYSRDFCELIAKVKKIFDPHGILNPGVKTGSSKEDIKKLLRGDYNLGHRHEHLPRS